MDTTHKYNMTISLHVLKHLGFNLYSNIPSVLSEVVANSYDADATKVTIAVDDTNETITIEDDGHGMTLSDINDKYLFVGYARREKGEGFSPKFNRPVMGRKGIGKLSLFSLVNQIEIHTVRMNPLTSAAEKNGLLMIKEDIEKALATNSQYHPQDIPSDSFTLTEGTRIILSRFKREFHYSSTFLRKRLARRFSILGDEYKFNILIDDSPITIKDRDYFSKIQFLWLIGSQSDIYSKHFKFEKVENLNGSIDGSDGYKISGWIGAVQKPSHLEQDGINNNKISIICRGKMAEEDILESFEEGGIYIDYLVGEIHADFLDDDSQEDITTSSRQKINENDPRYVAVRNHVYNILKRIQNVWSKYRTELGKKTAVENAEQINPAIKTWFETLRTDPEKEHALTLFSTIDGLHFDKEEEKDKKKELYKHGILAFEKLRLKSNLGELEKIKSANDVHLAAVFSDLTDIEANMYYDIASQRVEIIKKFKVQLDANNKEKLLQTYLFDNLWLLHPSWEMATKGTETMEQNVQKEFKAVVKTLSEQERKGRIDIKYRTAAGKHVIVELKRYKPTYKITSEKLLEQVKKYKTALTKCLKTLKKDSEPIEIIVVLGEPIKNEDPQTVEKLLAVYGARLIFYDQLIESSIEAYSDYMKSHERVGKIRAIIDQI